MQYVHIIHTMVSIYICDGNNIANHLYSVVTPILCYYLKYNKLFEDIHELIFCICVLYLTENMN